MEFRRYYLEVSKIKTQGRHADVKIVKMRANYSVLHSQSTSLEWLRPENWSSRQTDLQAGLSCSGRIRFTGSFARHRFSVFAFRLPRRWHG